MNTKLLLKQAKKWVEQHPTFTYDPDSSSVEGFYEFLHPETKKCIDGYYIKIVLYKTSLSTSFPHVYETKGRVPWEIDRHVYSDGRLCLTTKLTQYHACRRGIDFSTFIKTVVEPFLATQLLIEMKIIESFPQGEYSHGGEGIVEGYYDHLGVRNPEKLIQRKRQHPNRPCFCGSGKNYKRCCRELVRKVGFVDPKDIDHEIKWIKNSMKTKDQENKPDSNTKDTQLAT
jgi:hypothetical protein